MARRKKRTARKRRTLRKKGVSFGVSSFLLTLKDVDHLRQGTYNINPHLGAIPPVFGNHQTEPLYRETLRFPQADADVINADDVPYTPHYGDLQPELPSTSDLIYTNMRSAMQPRRAIDANADTPVNDWVIDADANTPVDIVGRLFSP